MKRLSRISLILLVSGTLMVFLAQKRLALVEKIHSSDGKSANLESEAKMAYMALGMAGLMIATGLGLTVTTILRARKAKNDPSNHG